MSFNMYETTNIMSFGSPVLDHGGKKAPKYYETREINKTKDIDGATTSFNQHRFTQKPYLYDTSDVDGSKPKRIEKTRNDPDRSLMVDDIDGARTFIKDKMLRTGRHVNPLMPEYKLPSYQKYEHQPPKFLRNTLDVSDVDGAQSKVPKKFAPRVTMQADDIEGAQANWRPRHRRARLEAPPLDNMYVADIIAQHDPLKVTNRRTNVMAPSYQIYGQTIEDDPKYTKPKSLPKEIFSGHLLRTDDINTSLKNWQPSMRREIRNITSTADIEGAQADTLIKSIVTKRETHPLQPVYQALDKGQLLEPPIQPLLPAKFITRPRIIIGKDNGGPESSSTPPAAAPEPSSYGETLNMTQAAPDSGRNDMASFTDTTEMVTNSTPKVAVPSLDIQATDPNARGAPSRTVPVKEVQPLSGKSGGSGRNNSGRNIPTKSPVGSVRSARSDSNSQRRPSLAERKAADDYAAEIASVRDL